MLVTFGDSFNSVLSVGSREPHDFRREARIASKRFAFVGNVRHEMLSSIALISCAAISA